MLLLAEAMGLNKYHAFAKIISDLLLRFSRTKYLVNISTSTIMIVWHSVLTCMYLEVVKQLHYQNFLERVT